MLLSALRSFSFPFLFSLLCTHVTGDHGNQVVVNKRSVRTVTEDVWQAIRNIYPSAIQHSFEPTQGQDLITQVTGANCSICRMEQETSSLVLQLAIELSQRCHARYQQSSSICLSLGLGDIIEHTVHAPDSQQEDKQFFVVQKQDIQRWVSFVNIMRRKDARRSSALLEQCVSDHLLPSTSTSAAEPIVLDDVAVDAEVIMADTHAAATKTVPQLIKPLVCVKHKRCLRKAICSGDGILHSSDLCLFDGQSFNEFMSHVTSLFILTAASKDNEYDKDIDGLLAEGIEIVETNNLSSLYPALHTRSPILSSQESTIRCTSEVGSIKLYLSEEMCCDDKCNKQYTQIHCTDSGTVNTTRRTKDKEKRPSRAASNSQMVISVDSDSDDAVLLHPVLLTPHNRGQAMAAKCNVSVYEVKIKSSDRSIADALQQLNTTPDDQNDSAGPRRSARNKKRFPVGVLIDLDNMQYDPSMNIAALRLQLYEKCQHGSAYELHHRLTLCVSTPVTQIDESPPMTIRDGPMATDEYTFHELSFKHNEKTMQSILDELPGSSSDASARMICIVRSTEDMPDLLGYGKDALLDICISQSNTSEPDGNKDGRAASSKSKKVEKGFRGTLLTGGPASAAVTNNGNKPDTDADVKSSNSDSSSSNIDNININNDNDSSGAAGESLQEVAEVLV
jgi:hypothetical protein